MVLNVNNMRDMDTDRRAGKRTVAVRLGLPGAALYHALLALLTLALWTAFCLARDAILLPGLILFLPLGRAAWKAARHTGDASCLNRQLRATVLASALLNAGMGVLCLAVR
jgi:1,4-dihydroxy-2-naphthoate octaprenyltransferase